MLLMLHAIVLPFDSSKGAEKEKQANWLFFNDLIVVQAKPPRKRKFEFFA
jgi:hypothetical protein